MNGLGWAIKHVVKCTLEAAVESVKIYRDMVKKDKEMREAFKKIK
jgi:hypothetical protein